MVLWSIEHTWCRRCKPLCHQCPGCWHALKGAQTRRNWFIKLNGECSTYFLFLFLELFQLVGSVRFRHKSRPLYSVLYIVWGLIVDRFIGFLINVRDFWRSLSVYFGNYQVIPGQTDIKDDGTFCRSLQPIHL